MEKDHRTNRSLLEALAQGLFGTRVCEVNPVNDDMIRFTERQSIFNIYTFAPPFGSIYQKFCLKSSGIFDDLGSRVDGWRGIGQ